jgi:RNA polymerase sigma factor (sigma-70 family)
MMRTLLSPSRPILMGSDEEFVQHHWRLALWVARRRAVQAGWRGDPDEVQSDAVLGLWNAARTITPVHLPGPWVSMHVNRTITDGLRHRYGDIRYNGKAALTAATGSLEKGTSGTDRDPIDYAVAAVNRVDVARALVRLTPRYRYVVVARYRDELSWRAIGEYLGVTEGRAHQLGTEARQRLTYWLAPH